MAQTPVSEKELQVLKAMIMNIKGGKAEMMKSVDFQGVADTPGSNAEPLYKSYKSAYNAVNNLLEKLCNGDLKSNVKPKGSKSTDDGSPKTPRKRKAKAMDEETEEKSPKKKVLKEGDTMQFVPEGASSPTTSPVTERGNQEDAHALKEEF